jgi:hypothetical protein
MRAFGTVAVVIFAFVLVLFHGIPEPVLGAFDVVGNGRKVSEFQRRAVLLHEFHQVNFMKFKIVLIEREFFLREIIRLVDEVEIFGIHLAIGF